jgi:cytochrome c
MSLPLRSTFLGSTLVLALATAACASPMDETDDPAVAGAAATKVAGPTATFQRDLAEASVELLASLTVSGGETKVGQNRNGECVLTGLASGAHLTVGEVYAVDAPHIGLDSSDPAHLTWTIPLTRTTAPTTKARLSCIGGESPLSVTEVQELLRAGAHQAGASTPQQGASARLWTARNSLPATGATGPELFQSQACSMCHTVDGKLVGPGFKDVAAKYTADTYAVATLSSHIIAGSKDRWGHVPMPANNQITERASVVLARWVLSQQ